MSDPVAHEQPDPAASGAEELDEDSMRLDPLEEGMDPPEHWAQADHFGNTPTEMRRGESLDERLREEEPDTPAEAVDEVTDDELDEGIDGVLVTVEPLPDDEQLPAHDWAAERGQSADVAGGSVAEEIRTPRERPR